METNAIEPPTRTHDKGNHSRMLHHHNQYHRHETFPETAILTVVIPVVIVILLGAISIVIALLRRMKSSKPNGNTKGNKTCMFGPHSIITFNPTTGN